MDVYEYLQKYFNCKRYFNFILTSTMYLNKNWENFNFSKCKLKIINKKSKKLSPNFINSIKKKEKLKKCRYI